MGKLRKKQTDTKNHEEEEEEMFELKLLIATDFLINCMYFCFLLRTFSVEKANHTILVVRIKKRQPWGLNQLLHRYILKMS